ncbi:hypothetical protein ACIQU5_31240 [Streptomyces sp. NPDC090306]|uniref:hypothetical protein n=1 Tax=Streptomyces sp. NPDC090306 TaxID=3365961 RepID=UPI0038005C28
MVNILPSAEPQEEGAVSLLPSADVFRSIELQASQLLRGQLVCPHAPGERCSAAEHLTLSEAKDAAARDAADTDLRDALWRCVGRDARSDLPNLAQRSQLLALYFIVPYLRKSAGRVSRTLCVDVSEVRSAMVFGALHGLALATERDDVRGDVVRSANAAGWAVERADPVERTTDPHSLVDRTSRFDDGYSPLRNESGIQMVGKTDPLSRGRIDGERMGATLHRLGLLGAFLAAGSEQVPVGVSDEPDGTQKEVE